MQLPVPDSNGAAEYDALQEKWGPAQWAASALARRSRAAHAQRTLPAYKAAHRQASSTAGKHDTPSRFLHDRARKRLEDLGHRGAIVHQATSGLHPLSRFARKAGRKVKRLFFQPHPQRRLA